MKKAIITFLVLLLAGCAVRIDTTDLYRKLVLYSVLNSKSAYHVIILDSLYSLDSPIVIDSCGIRDAEVIVTDNEGNIFPFDSLDSHGHYVNKIPFYPVPGREYSLNLKYKDFYEINVMTTCPQGVVFNKQEYHIDSIYADTIYWNYTDSCLYDVITWDSLYGYTDFYEYSYDTIFTPENLIDYYLGGGDTSSLTIKFYVYKYDKNFSEWYMERYYNNEFNPIENQKTYIGYFSSCTVDSVDVIIER
ncbi:hypothetical protein DRP44_05300 [candidate division TA06 bacterium]|uniref:DUF4249 family protein n=1 Tax=candidate division TA06 bacterium TaxID=2250710 RepID=A0A660S7L1_UNCT6|nr:MAG: hypothetical protein DRP44_05300 [candidate division TA06 bacterium]